MRLIEKCGGRETFARRLEYALENGLIDFGNEPSFYTPFLFSFVGRHDLTAKWAMRMRAAFPSRRLVVRTQGDVAKGVRRVCLNGREIGTRMLRHAELVDGGKLVFFGDLL